MAELKSITINGTKYDSFPGAATGNGVLVVAQPDAPDDTAVLWVDTDDAGESEISDSKYFDIDYDGIVSLNPNYLSTLPEKVAFPEFINGVAVSGFQAGMFQGNLRVKEIVLPDTVSSIPENFCKEAKNLRLVKNTEHIESVGASAFYQTRIEKAMLPNLKELGSNAFRNCIYLRIVDIGDVENIPDYAFCWCSNLSLFKGGANVKTIGKHAFRCALTLKNLPFLSGNKVTSIDDYAFFNCRIQFDWALLTACTFSTNYPTPIADNTSEYWVGADYTPCENKLVTMFSQRDTRWANETIGSTNAPYSNGCAFISAIHIHSAFTDRLYSTPMEFEAEIEALDSALLTQSPNNPDNVANILTALGYSVTKLSGEITNEKLEQAYEALSNGAYVFCGMSTTSNVNGSHSILLYGVNGIGEVMVLDSDSGGHFFDDYCNTDVLTYQIPIQNLTGPSTTMYIVSKS